VDLMREWMRLLTASASTGDVAGAGSRLIEAYAEPHRRYHDVRHLREVLGHIDNLAPAAQDADLVRLAAWFHDAVYDPTRADNEDASAQVAALTLAALGVPTPRHTAVARLVRLTATHDPGVGDDDGAVLCDADLAILGSDAVRYAEYCADVRAEYVAVPDEAFAVGRAEVLRRLLAREPLFRTPPARSRWEAQARDNMSLELHRLSQATPDPIGRDREQRPAR